MLAAQHSVPAQVVNEIHFRLGLAWLRLGETQNCVLNPNADHCILPIRPGGFHTLPEGSRQAIPYFQAVLDNTAAEERLHLSARWLLNIAYMTLGQYPEGVPLAHQIPPKAFESQAAFPRWVNVAPALGLDTFSLSGGAVADDFDGDGYLDFFVSTSDLTGQLRFFRNGGDGTFADRTEAANLNGLLGGLNLVQADYDNDGHLDLLVAAYSATVADIAAAHLGHPVSVEQARLYRGDGQGGFADVSQDRHFAQPAKPMGANFGDVDHDGFLDVYLGTGDTDYAELMPNVLYWNQGGQRFADVTFASGLGHLQKGHGVVFADVDHDGDVDLFEQMGGAYRGDGFADVLYENPGFGHGWLAVEVVGVESNRSGIGTQLRVDVVDRGQRRSLYRWVGSGGSFGGNPLRQYVGLGSAERVVQLVVFWPQSGSEQVFDEVPVNAIIQVTEGRDQLEILALPAFKFEVEHPKRAEHHLHK